MTAVRKQVSFRCYEFNDGLCLFDYVKYSLVTNTHNHSEGERFVQEFEIQALQLRRLCFQLLTFEPTSQTTFHATLTLEEYRQYIVSWQTLKSKLREILVLQRQQPAAVLNTSLSLKEIAAQGLLLQLRTVAHLLNKLPSSTQIFNSEGQERKFTSLLFQIDSFLGANGMEILLRPLPRDESATAENGWPTSAEKLALVQLFNWGTKARYLLEFLLQNFGQVMSNSDCLLAMQTTGTTPSILTNATKLINGKMQRSNHPFEIKNKRDVGYYLERIT